MRSGHSSPLAAFFLGAALFGSACGGGEAPQPRVVCTPQTEACANGLDDDCDGLVDAADPADCPAGCADVDGDGYGTGLACLGPDCDDGDGTVHPGATEVCDALHADEDCSGAADDDDPAATGKQAWYADLDADGLGVASTAVVTCQAPAGYVATAGDLDGDASSCTTELSDMDGDGTPDCRDPCEDGDRDGYGVDRSAAVVGADAFSVGACTTDGSTPCALAAACLGTDCAAGDAAVHPGAVELAADGVDQDCDGMERCYADGDRDGYRPDATSTVASANLSCADAGEATSSAPVGDCNDALASVHPGATELVANGVDEDCDGTERCYVDGDGDGYRPDATSTVASPNGSCADTGEATSARPTGDCDDTNATIFPGAVEIVGDEVDQTCDGRERCFVDADDDGWRPDATSWISSSNGSCHDAGEALATDPIGDCDDHAAAVQVQVCGDAFACGTEACDDGDGVNADSWSATRHCNGSCTAWAPSCGDGTPDAGFEVCDDGPTNGDGWAALAHCRADCQGLAPYCGDGTLQAGSEACEGTELAGKQCSSWPDYTDGALACTPSCTFELAACTGPYSPGAWYGLGGSDLGPQATRLAGSASGCGVAGLAPAWQSANRPSVAVDAQGHLVVAWSEVAGTGQAYAYVLRHDGTGWRELGGSASGSGISRAGQNAINVRVALYGNGFPVVVWEESYAYGSDVFVKSWNGTAWVELDGSASGGGLSNSGYFSTLPDVAVDHQQRPIVVWQEDKVQYYPGTYYGTVFGKRFDGVHWVELAGSATGYGISTFTTHKYGDEPRVIVDHAGRPVVAWAENRGGDGMSSDITGIYVRRFEGGAWVGINGSDANKGVSAACEASGPRRPAIAEDANGRLWVAWDASRISYKKDVYLATFDGSSWIAAAGSLTNGGLSGTNAADSMAPSITIDGAGRPVVAWWENVGVSRQVWARRLGAGAWEELAGSGSAGGISDHRLVAELPALATNGAGEPLAVWVNRTSNCGNSVYLRQWDGAAWSELDPQPVGGGLRDTSPSVPQPRLAVDPAGVPTVAFLAKPGTEDQLHVRTYDGTGWPGLAGSAASPGIGTAGTRSIYPAIALDGDRRPVVAWVELPSVAPYNRVYLRRWDGSAWIELGGSASGNGIASSSTTLSSPVVAIDASGCPVVAWKAATGTIAYEVHARRWDGSAWVELAGSATGGGVSASGGKVSDLAMAVDGDQILVVWGAQGEIFGKLWNGTAWIGLGSSADAGGISAASAAASYTPAAAFDGGGRPVVAWLENVAARQYRLCLRRFDGTSWAELAGSATGDGIGGALVDTGKPALAIDAAGNPVVAWDQEAAGVREIYARRWSGTAWVHLGGSDRGGGISNSHAASLEPSLAAGGGRICVAWHEDATRSPQLLVRCIDDP